jgi:hypothetical protein
MGFTGFRILFRGATIQAHYRDGIDDVTVIGPTFAGAGVPARWYYIAVNYDRGGNMELFVDTLSYGTVAINNITNWGELYFYMAYDGDNIYSNPAIGSVSAHTRILTQGEIQTAYRYGVTNEFGTESHFAYRASDVIWLQGGPSYEIYDVRDRGVGFYYNPDYPVAIGEDGVTFGSTYIAGAGGAERHIIPDRRSTIVPGVNGRELRFTPCNNGWGQRFGNLGESVAQTPYLE